MRSCRGGVTLEKDLVASAGCVLAAEEMVEAHLVQGGLRGVRRDVTADRNIGILLAGHHDGGVPARPASDFPLKVLVAWVVRLIIDADGVDVRGHNVRRNGNSTTAGVVLHRLKEIAGARSALAIDESLNRLNPFLRFFRIDVRYLA